MKKMLTLFCLIFIIALHLGAQVRLGPEVGVNLAHYKLNAGFFAFSASSKPGIIAGAVVDIPLSSHFYLRPAARFVSTSYDLNYTIAQLQGTINSVQVPVNLLFKTGREGNRLILGAGPYAAYNVIAKEHITTSGILSQWGVPDNIDSMRNLNAGDLGIGFTAGYEFASHFTVQAHLQRSYGHLFFDTQGITVKNYNLAVTLAYLFGGSNNHRY